MQSWAKACTASHQVSGLGGALPIPGDATYELQMALGGGIWWPGMGEPMHSNPVATTVQWEGSMLPNGLWCGTWESIGVLMFPENRAKIGYKQRYAGMCDTMQQQQQRAQGECAQRSSELPSVGEHIHDWAPNDVTRNTRCVHTRTGRC